MQCGAAGLCAGCRTPLTPKLAASAASVRCQKASSDVWAMPTRQPKPNRTSCNGKEADAGAGFALATFCLRRSGQNDRPEFVVVTRSPIECGQRLENVTKGVAGRSTCVEVVGSLE